MSSDFSHLRILISSQRWARRILQSSRNSWTVRCPSRSTEVREWQSKSYFQLISSGRKVEGVLRGFDPFMNLVIDDAIEYRKGLCFVYRLPVWQIVILDNSSHTMGMCVIRGNSVLMIEAMERIWPPNTYAKLSWEHFYFHLYTSDRVSHSRCLRPIQFMSINILSERTK